jgi:hypothetical protein
VDDELLPAQPHSLFEFMALSGIVGTCDWQSESKKGCDRSPIEGGTLFGVATPCECRYQRMSIKLAKAL